MSGNPPARRLPLRGGLALAAGLLTLAPLVARGDADADRLWQRLRGEPLVVLVRHAAAPGNFDPPGFRLDDCSTQRNLSEAGREQARRLGEAVRRNEVRIGLVRSSRWCRARETAALAFGDYEPWPELDSFVGSDRSDLARRTARVREAIAGWSGPGTLVLVSHHFIISAVVERAPGEAEMIVVAPKPGGFEVLGSITPPAELVPHGG